MMPMCSICQAEIRDTEDAKHLPLYCNGSEGITVCLSCRMALTETARNMMRLAQSSRMIGYRYAKSIAAAKRKREEKIKDEREQQNHEYALEQCFGVHGQG